MCLFPFQDSCNKFVAPHDVMKFSEGLSSDFTFIIMLGKFPTLPKSRLYSFCRKHLVKNRRPQPCLRLYSTRFSEPLYFKHVSFSSCIRRLERNLIELREANK